MVFKALQTVIEQTDRISSLTQGSFISKLTLQQYHDE